MRSIRPMLHVMAPLVLVLVFSQACKARSDYEVRASKSASAPTTILMMGGYNSCGYADESGNAVSLEDQSQTSGKRPPVFRTPYHSSFFPAFESILEQHKSPNIRTLVSCYEDADDIVFSTDQTQSDRANPQALQRMKRPEFFQAVRSFVGDSPGAIYIIGHSYGGRTAMQTVLEFSNAQAAAIQTLVTIDPISYHACLPSDFVAMSSLFGGGNSSYGCLNAPYELTPQLTASAARQQLTIREDLRIGELKKITSRVKNWMNFYQTNYGRLHSSAIQAAHDNVPVVYPANHAANQVFGGAHSFIAEDQDRVRGRIERAVFRSDE